MKVVATGGGKAWLVDQPDPEPQGDEVVAKVHWSPICGSNLHGFTAEGEHVNTGHEGTGEVVAVDKPKFLKVGDRVVLNPCSMCGDCLECRQGDYILCRHKPPFMGHFCEYVRIQEAVCWKLPEDISTELGSMLGCALAPGYNALKRMGVKANHTVLITGLGPVGLGAAAQAVFRGALVIAADPVEWRRNRAAELGVQHVLDPSDSDTLEAIRDLTSGRGVERAADCSANPTAERLCMDALAPNGWMAIVGENPGKIEISPSSDFIRREIHVLGAWHCNLNDGPAMMDFLRRSPKAPLLISHRYGFSQAQEAFETAISRNSAKVILNPWE